MPVNMLKMAAFTRCLLSAAVFLSAFYTAAGQCSGTTTQVTADSTMRNITGPTSTGGGSTQYAQAPYLCSWLITPAAGHGQIVIYFQTFSTETSAACGSTDDYVIIVDGPSRNNGFHIGCLSGTISNVAGQGLRAIGSAINNQLYIEFVADGDGNTGTGFWIKYLARAEATETSSGLSTGALIGIVVAVIVVVLVVIVVVVVVVLKKQQRRIDEMEWSDSDYYDSDESDSEEEDEESRPEPSGVGRAALPPLNPANPMALSRAAVDMPENYKAPGALPSLNREDIEKQKKKARRRRRRRKKRQSSVQPTVNGQANRDKLSREQTEMSVSTVATARAVVIGSSGNVADSNSHNVLPTAPPEKTLSDLEDEIAGASSSQPVEHTIQSSRRRDDDDPVFVSSNFKPAAQNSYW